MKTNVAVALLLAMGALNLGTVTASAAGPVADDLITTSKVQTALSQEPTLRSSLIAVKTIRGVVQLSGVVEKARDIQTAAALAGSVPGVVQVRKEFVAVKQ